MKDPPEFYQIMSLRLSRALGDIGINSWMVRRRRRTFLMIEAIVTITENLQGYNFTNFHFGSQSEGTTTQGLNSDIDILSCFNDFNIMSSWSDWEPGRENMLMVKEETCSPQHYQLHAIRQDTPEPVIITSDSLESVNRNGRAVLKNTHSKTIAELHSVRWNKPIYSSGPSHSIFEMADIVHAYRSRALPPECLKWFERPRPGHWPTPELFREVRECGCFLVPDGYFESIDKHLEWRISPNLVERALMFKMQTLKLKCYVVLKILKAHVINPRLDDHGKLTSFHCKTALFFAAERLPPEMWREHRLMECIVYCLKLLLGWTNTGMCPHYIVEGVNLFHGKFTNGQLANLSQILSNIIDCHLAVLAFIEADDLGHRMVSTHIRTVRNIGGRHLSAHNSLCRWLSVFAHISLKRHLLVILNPTCDFMPGQLCIFLCQYLQTVRTYAHYVPSLLWKQCFEIVSTQILSILASTVASCCIRKGCGFPRNVLSLFESSLDTDVASSRLKLASFLVCYNEFERAVDLLNDVERRYDDSVQAVCGCGGMDPFDKELQEQLCTTSLPDNDDVLLTNKTALCVRYLKQEVSCAPPILREAFGQDNQYRDLFEYLLGNFVVVDALPYLYYLQYLTFRRLSQRGRQVQAFLNFINCCLNNRRRSQIYHLLTYLILLGHCCEMEGMPEWALLFYNFCVEMFPRNNAARMRIDRLYHGCDV